MCSIVPLGEFENIERLKDFKEGGSYMEEKLHEKEKKLLEFIQELQYGEVTIKVQDGLPVMIERVKEKVKL